MTEGMRRNVFINTRLPDKIFHHQKDHYPCQFTATAIKKDYILITGFDIDMSPYFVSVYVDIFNCRRSNRDQSFLIPFTDDADKSNLRVEAGQTQIYQFAYPKATTVHGFQYGFVPATLRR